MRRVDPKLYTKEYYLTDCTGYKEFKQSHGEKLEPRFQRIAELLPSVRRKRVLDIGCGRGEMVFWTITNGAKYSVGIDYSQDAVQLAQDALLVKNNSTRNKAAFYVMDGKELLFPADSFDLVLLTEVWEHIYPEEQEAMLKEILRVLSPTGKIVIHTAPNRLFNDFTYRWWCYPVSWLLVSINNLLLNKMYTHLTHPADLRTEYHKVMHVNEPTYFSMRSLFSKFGLTGLIKSTNVTAIKPILSWKDKLFNLLVYLHPLSCFPPLNVLWGNDFWVVLQRKNQ